MKEMIGWEFDPLYSADEHSQLTSELLQVVETIFQARMRQAKQGVTVDVTQIDVSVREHPVIVVVATKANAQESKVFVYVGAFSYTGDKLSDLIEHCEHKLAPDEGAR